MSSFIKQLKNPKTGKKQKALCIDDFFGEHEYGYFFLKSGEDATWDDYPFKEEFDVFNEDEVGL